MPKVMRPIPETEESVTRPVIVDITRQLFAYTGISEETQILYPGTAEATFQPGSTISKQQAGVNFNQNNRVFIDVEEENDPDNILTEAVFVGEQLRIFMENELDIHIKPVYSMTNVTINFRYRTADKVAAFRWRDEIRARIANGREGKLLTASYHYIIPEAFLVILNEIHRLRETVAPYGQDYNDWFTQHLTPRASLATNLAGGYKTWVVAETQQEIIGQFDFEGAPEKGSRAGEAEAWEISFSYKFQYEKPIECVMRYPLMVHNQILAAKWRPAEPVYKPENTKRLYGNSRRHFAQFERQSMLDCNCRFPGVSIPAWDEFLPASVPWGTMRVFTAMVALDPGGDLKSLFNMTRLGTKQIKPEILEFMKGEAPYIHQINQSVLMLTGYIGANPMEQGAIVMDADLAVSSVEPLELRKPYHVRLSYVRDLRTLTKPARDRMREHGRATIEILKTIDCTLEGKGLLPSVLPGTDFIPEGELNDAIEEINRDIDGGNIASNQLVQFNTVQTFFIESHRAKS